MENKTGYERLDGSEYDLTGNTSQFTSSKTSLSYQQEFSADDILLEDYPEEEIFVLSEGYVKMEGEYVMWQEGASCMEKNKTKDLTNDYEGQLVLPFEDSLHSLGEYFILKTGNRPIIHN